MLGPWHTDAQTSMFFVMKSLIGKMTYGRGEQTSKFETTKNGKTQKNKRTSIDQNI